MRGSCPLLFLLDFDVRQKDTDDEGVGLRQAVLRWAGKRRGPGQLLLTSEAGMRTKLKNARRKGT